MNEELLLAVQNSKSWLDLFDRRFYKKAFRAYQDQYAAAFREVFRICSTEEMLASAAEWMVTELEKGWKRQRFWNRSAVRLDCKQMIIVYLSPMLLAMEEPEGPRFAQLLREAWAKRCPKDVYDVATFEKLAKGFHHAILGVELSAFNRAEEEEE